MDAEPLGIWNHSDWPHKAPTTTYLMAEQQHPHLCHLRRLLFVRGERMSWCLALGDQGTSPARPPSQEAGPSLESKIRKGGEGGAQGGRGQQTRKQLQLPGLPAGAAQVLHTQTENCSWKGKKLLPVQAANNRAIFASEQALFDPLICNGRGGTATQSSRTADQNAGSHGQA